MGVVLFDEVEKAHPRVLTLLLQLLDEGRLTDSKGRTVDFTNTVIILTSNIGAEYLLQAAGKKSLEEKETLHEKVKEMVRASFAPEFLNRLSATAIFDSLDKGKMEMIVQKAMAGVKRRLQTKGVNVILEHSGARALLDSSFDPSYGARPVERFLEGTVVTQLSRMLISGELASGSTVHIESVDSEDDSLDDCNFPVAKKTRPLNYRVVRDSTDVQDENMEGMDYNWEQIL